MDRVRFHVQFNAGRDSDFIDGTNLSTWTDFQKFYVRYMNIFQTGGRAASYQPTLSFDVIYLFWPAR